MKKPILLPTILVDASESSVGTRVEFQVWVRASKATAIDWATDVLPALQRALSRANTERTRKIAQAADDPNDHPMG